MPASLRVYRLSRWSRLLTIVLVGAVLGQGLPVQSVVQWVQSVSDHPEHPCMHQGICPKNPDGPCTCDHSSSPVTEAEVPALKTCTGGQANKATAPVPTKWLSDSRETRLVASLALHRVGHLYLGLSSQLVGDEVFRPPRRRTG